MHYLLRYWFGPKVEIGQTWELDDIFNNKSPFSVSEKTYVEVVDVKDKWVKYKYEFGRSFHSNEIRMFRSSYKLVE